MASHKGHDRAALHLTPLYIVTALHLLPPSGAVCSIYAYIIGWVWLSPDLDLKQSVPSQRWDGLNRYWKQYRKWIKHREASHWIFIGTLTRVVYLLPLALPLFYSIAWAAGWGLSDLYSFRDEAAAIFIGLEVSAWVHLCMDYLPGLNKL